jgi:hypothetical protein
MAAFETTPVAIPRADQPTIIQRFLSTSERFLFHPPAAASGRVRAHVRGPSALHDDGLLCSPSPRGIQTGAQRRAAA